MNKSRKDWEAFSKANFRGGYTPGGRAVDLYTSGQTLAKLLFEWGVWKAGDRILDVGCGNGRLAMGLIKQKIIYKGLDVIPASIEFCRKAFEGYPEFSFDLLPLRNGHYAPMGREDPAKVVYPMTSHVADVVVANSLFSHTETLEVAAANLAEMYRVLRLEGILFSTWRLVPPHEQVDTSADHTNYLHVNVIRMIKAAGFAIIKTVGVLPREMPVLPNDSQTGFVAVRQ